MAIIDKPSDYFRTKLYAGNATNNRAITWDETNTNMQADLLWFKSRTDTQTHGIWDSVRGAIKRLIPSSTGAEGDEANDLDSFDTNGFTVDSAANMNGSSRNYVTWGWKAGTSFTNDASATGIGTIDSTGSVSDTSGFSIVSYTGTGSNGTIKHGLNSKPQVIFVKARTGDTNWGTYHEILGNTKFMRLNQTNAAETEATFWNSTTATSSVFSVGSNIVTNWNTKTMIAYCFAEKQGYSKFGSYVGSNSGAYGPFIYTGFKPAFVLIKDSSAGNAWTIRDDKRNTFNPATNFLMPNETDAEVTAGEAVDILSNGFKIKANGGKVQDSGNTYIYMAFAENPFVASNFNAATAR